MARKPYIQPNIKSLLIDSTDGILAAASPTTMTIGTRSNNPHGVTSSDDIGAKADNTSDGWDDWGEEE